MMIKSKRLPFYIAGGAGLSALAAALGFSLTSSSSGAVTATPPSTVVQTRGTSLGSILVDSQGRSLYLFEQDTGTTSTCTGSCTSVWPPVPASAAPTVAGGAAISALGVTSGGTRQLTYAGHPLYYFAGDSKAGQTRGQAIDEFGARWYVLNPAGAAITAAPAAPANPPNNDGGYGY